MKSNRWIVIALASLTLGLFAGAAGAGDPAADQEAAMKVWMEASTPGEQHEFLARLVGDWNVTTKSWHDPAGEPEIATGTVTATMIMDGRYVQEEMSSTVMGMPFHGMSVTGYNNVTGEFEAVWIDNMSTFFTISMSERPDENTLVGKAVYTDPMTKAKATAKVVTEIHSADKHTFTWYTEMGGQEVKMMEVEYVRK